MKKMLCILVGLLCFALSQKIYAQDITIDTAYFLTTKHQVLNVVVKNAGNIKLPYPILIYIALHEVNDNSTPVAQIQLLTKELKVLTKQSFHVDISAFLLTTTGKTNKLKTLTIICDPDNKLIETNETNNTYILDLKTN
jgi:hypothetical protein